MPEMTVAGLPRRLLMGPGPSEVHPRVLQAMSKPPLGHLDPDFLALMTDAQRMLRDLYRTQNALTFAVSGTGMAGMETCIVNLLEPGDTILVCAKGYFGHRMIEVASRTGAKVESITRPFGQVFTLDEIREAVQRVKPKAVGIVHAETSTGALQPHIAEIGAICREAGALLILDTVTSLGGVPVEIDAWGVDAVYSGTQKCISAPPGLSPVSFSPRALDVIMSRKRPVQSWYMDASQIAKYVGTERLYHHTAPITMIYAMHEGLRIIFEEGLEARFDRHRRNHLAMKAGLEALGLNYTADPANLLPQLNAVLIPAGVDDLTVRKRLATEFNIEVGGGLGEFKGRAWRIGLMGCGSTPENIRLVLEALETCLVDAGVRFPPNAGVEAAEALLAV